MMRASGTSAQVEVERIPLSPAARATVALDPDTMDALVTGGDDYEILCALAEDHVASFLDEAAALGVPAAVIGTVTEGDGLPVFRGGGAERRYEHGSYRHF
jgi:thiamine-monophosphate kinase